MQPDPADPLVPADLLDIIARMRFVPVGRTGDGEPFGVMVAPNLDNIGHTLLVGRGEKPGSVTWGFARVGENARLPPVLVTERAHQALSTGEPDGNGGVRIGGLSLRLRLEYDAGQLVARV